MSDPTTKPEAQPLAISAEAPKIEDVIDKDATVSSEEVVKAAEELPQAETKVEEPKKEEDEVKEESSEPKEITHGTLSKTHGGLLSFFKQKRFFYFNDDAIADEKLKTYLHKENAIKANAAHASQTGKGLWFYSKEESHKDSPHGIIKLADVSDVVPSAASKFVLKISTGDLHFEAPASERDSWVFTLKGKVAEAKTSEQAILESEGYKTALEKFRKSFHLNDQRMHGINFEIGKPTVASTMKSPEKNEETKETDNNKQETVEKPEPIVMPETAVISDEEAGPSEMKRSMSKKGKRSSSVFAMFGKKDKADDKKEDLPKEDAPIAAEEANVAEATHDISVGTSPTDATEPAVNAEEEVKPDDESKTVEETASSPKNPKRHSFFGSLFKKEETEKKEKEDKKEEVIEGPAKETPTVPENVEQERTKTVDVADETPSAEKSTPSSPPKTKFLSNIFEKKDKSPPKVEDESKKEDETQPEIKVEEPSETSPEGQKEAPVSPEQPADATSTPKEKRKSNFFSSFKKEKKVEEKKSEEVKSDTEDVEAPKPSTSPVPKGLLTGLMRKASRSKSSERKAEVKDVVAPATVTEEPTETATPIAAAETAKAEASSEGDKTAPVIGDVVPDAIIVGSERTPQANI
ncbi:Pleckstrin homology domain-containing protein [Geopyxis carbonaria]|nr:Pleckstrin homology domain-containing protein [Geopyxis carbonaria]